MYVIVGGDEIKKLFTHIYAQDVGDRINWIELHKATVFDSEETVDNYLKMNSWWAKTYDIQKAKINPLNFLCT